MINPYESPAELMPPKPVPTRLYGVPAGWFLIIGATAFCLRIGAFAIAFFGELFYKTDLEGPLIVMIVSLKAGALLIGGVALVVAFVIGNLHVRICAFVLAALLVFSFIA